MSHCLSRRPLSIRLSTPDHPIEIHRSCPRVSEALFIATAVSKSGARHRVKWRPSYFCVKEAHAYCVRSVNFCCHKAMFPSSNRVCYQIWESVYISNVYMETPLENWNSKRENRKWKRTASSFLWSTRKMGCKADNRPSAHRNREKDAGMEYRKGKCKLKARTGAPDLFVYVIKQHRTSVIFNEELKTQLARVNVIATQVRASQLYS